MRDFIPGQDNVTERVIIAQAKNSQGNLFFT